jgi:hypothetical protein
MRRHPFALVLAERGPELFREAGVLWLVFAVLDRLVTNVLTFAWVFSNVSAALVIWAVGIYFESRKKE